VITNPADDDVKRQNHWPVASVVSGTHRHERGSNSQL